jgi:uroporphyrinogen-III decarboxylase
MRTREECRAVAAAQAALDAAIAAVDRLDLDAAIAAADLTTDGRRERKVTT